MKLKKVTFDANGFRKLKSIEIEIGDRLTVIGGLNGIGKSTLLGLIANCSGVSGRSAANAKTKSYIKKKSYFDLPFQANFQELFHLDENDYQGDLQKKGHFEFIYELKKEVELNSNNYNEFIKKCNVSAHSDPIKSTTTEGSEEGEEESISSPLPAENKSKVTQKTVRYKVVPRSVNRSLGEYLHIGDDAKMPIPTIYLGMSRMTPIGEIKESIKTKRIRNMHDEDKEYFSSLFKRVINYDLNKDDNSIIDLDVKYSHKKFKIPSLQHNPFAISLGQDSLSSIFTALVSFYSLKREYKELYEGGILLIDEIDTGLHHIAQESLIELLKQEARRLNLQIIFTTHSLTIFKKILTIPKEQLISNNKILDKVVYLHDTYRPRVFKNPSYFDIKNNQLSLNTKVKPNNKEIKIYFEDDEAVWFYQQLLIAKNITNTVLAYSVDLKPVSLKLSCSILLSLSKADDFFKEVIIIADNDINTEKSNRNILDENPNIISLPGSSSFDENTPQKLRTPERIIYDYLLDKLTNYDTEFWDEIYEINNGNTDYDYFNNSVLNLDFEKNLTNVKYRELMKAWFKKHKTLFEDIKLIDRWTKDNSEQVDHFMSKLSMAISFISNRKWPSE